MNLLHPTLENTFFSEALPKQTISDYLSNQRPESFSHVLEDLITFINFTVLAVVLEQLETVQDRQKFVNEFIFRYTDSTFFDTFKDTHGEILSVIAEKIERMILSLQTN